MREDNNEQDLNNEMMENDEMIGNDEVTQDNQVAQDHEAMQDNEIVQDNEAMKDNEVTQDNETVKVNEVVQGNDKAPEKVKTKGKLVSIILAVIVSLGIVGTVFAKVAVPILLPQVFIADAIITTEKDLIKQNKSIQEITGVSLQEQIMKSEAMQTNFELNLQDITGAGTENVKGMIKGLGISSDVKTNLAGNKVIGNFSVNQNKLKLTGADFYRNGAEAGVVIPELFDKYIAVNLDTFVADYNGSALFSMLGTPIDETRYKAIKDYLDAASKKEFNSELAKKLTARSTALLKAADVKYAGKTDVKVGDKNKSYKTYDIVFNEAEIKSYLKDSFNILMEDKAFSDYITALDAMQESDGSEKASETMKKAKEDFNKAMDELQSIQVKTKLMIDSKKHIVQSIYEAEVSTKEEKTEIKLDSALTGDKFMTDAVKVSLSMKTGEEAVAVDFTSSSNYGAGEDKLVHNMALALSANGETATNMNLDMTYDTKAKENNVTVKANVKIADELEYAVDALATMNVDKSSKAVSVDMSNITLGLKSAYLDHSVIFTGKYGLKSIKASELESKQENVQYLFKMTEEELTALEQKISSGIMQIGSALFS